MSSKTSETLVSDNIGAGGGGAADFDIETTELPSSGSRAALLVSDAGRGLGEIELPENVSPAFKELASPKLPDLPRENRGLLLMQSPTRLFFYWTLGNNPYRQLQRLLGPNTGNYTLVLKLVELRSEYEEMHPVEPEGSWWFTVLPDAEYRAEIGLYSSNRPYIRVLFSNTVTTPRKSPSPRPAADAEWRVSSSVFAEVLDASGFTEDAFEVAFVSDGESGNIVEGGFTHAAFAGMIGEPEASLTGISLDELRFALMALAAGLPLEYLKWKINAELYALLQEHIDTLRADEKLAGLGESLDLEPEDFEFEYLEHHAVGGSLVNFPRRFRVGQQSTKYKPLSSTNTR